MVTDGTLDDQTAAGRFRDPNERVIVGDDTGEVFHVPPPAEELDRRMDSMCKFANGEEISGFLHPVLRSIILHFWLAYDHPFVDGNGRTARALFYWSMLRQGYWIVEFLSISQIIYRAPARYGRAFLYSETDDNDLTYFLLYHSDVICRAINELYEYMARHAKRLEDDEKALRGLAFLNYRQRELIHHALKNGIAIFTTEGHQNSHRVSYETARKDLMDLTKRRLLRARKNGRTWIFTPASEMRTGSKILIDSSGPLESLAHPLEEVESSLNEKQSPIIAPAKDWRRVVGASEDSEFTRSMLTEIEAAHEADRQAALAGEAP